ncbi:MAG TPA: BON domain-containing protein [Candidatus Binatia bacterium]|nr:BON domain-containing protein [Candidatus Binatia bacterium]
MNITSLPTVLRAAALGVLTMYLLDPVMGRRRRALARGQLLKLGKTTKETAGVTARDLKNRALGTVAEGRAALFEDSVDDSVLAARVRSKLGFVVRHPASIAVQASDGVVTLSGPVLADEVERLIAGVADVRGVRDVENRLEEHETADGVPGLQGDLPKPTGQTLDIFQDRWSPSTRFLLGTAGVVLIFGLNPFRKNAAAWSLLAGLGYLAWSVAEEEWRETSRSDRREAEMDKATAGWSA